MADNVTARRGASKFKPHSPGTHLMACVDVVDLGEKVQDYGDKPSYLAPTVSLVFASGERNEDGTLITVSKDYTVSTSERSNLRKDLESWRGKPWTDEEIDEGIPLGKLTGKLVLASVVNDVSKAKKRPFAKLVTLAPPMKGMEKNHPDVADYKRDSYWLTRIADNLAAADKWRNDQEDHRDPDERDPEPDPTDSVPMGDDPPF